MKKKEFSTSQKGLSIKAGAQSARVSVVVPCEPDGDPRACLAALAALPASEKALISEVFVAWGRHPSRQRNRAVRAARSAWVLFLDADSRAQAGLLPALLKAARDFKAAGVGGPNLALENEPALGRQFDRVLGSWAGSGASRARYRAVEPRRRCGEKELILCNLLLRRDVFLGAGGFREDLYPNEENELFNRLLAQGRHLAYEPAAVVRRPRRGSVGAFVTQAFRYGRGRAQQMRRNPYASDLVNLLPLLLQAALAAGLALFARGGWALPAAYLAGCALSQGLDPARSFYLMLRHQAYAAGLWAGAWMDPAPREGAIRLRRVRLGRVR